MIFVYRSPQGAPYMSMKCVMLSFKLYFVCIIMMCVNRSPQGAPYTGRIKKKCTVRKMIVDHLIEDIYLICLNI